jgi:hypothetical protein
MQTTTINGRHAAELNIITPSGSHQRQHFNAGRKNRGLED